jgi:adenylate cyclase
LTPAGSARQKRRVSAASAERVAAAIASEEARAFEIATRVRLLGLGAFAVWSVVENPLREAVFYLGVIALLAALGVLQWVLRHRGLDARLRLLFPLLDALVIAAIIVLPNPFDDTPHPIAQRYRWGNEIYLCALIGFSVFSYQPRVVVWTGVACALAWSLATVVALQSPGAYTLSAVPWATLGPEERVRLTSDPHLVYVASWGRDMVVMLVVSLSLALFVHRARQLVAQEARTERARANLARYVSANMVDALAGADEPFGATRRHHCAVLFADLAGFSTWAERESPDGVIAFLRDFHARMERAVFAHGGTLDKYIGDGVMATFGTPEPGASDAANALRCARAMQESVASWNAERQGRGESSVALGVGLHFGPVVLGDVGGPQRLEFAVLGDTVNVASRLERLTRTLGASIVVSDALLAVVRVDAGSDGLLAGFRRAPDHRVRGRDGDVALWYLPAHDDVSGRQTERA